MIKAIKRLAGNELFCIFSGAILFFAAIILGAIDFPTASLVLYICALAVSGFRVFAYALRGIFRGDFLDEKFLMSIASVGALVIGEYTEGVAVMLFFLVGEFFEHRAVRKSRNSIKSLMAINADEAQVLRDGEEITVDAEDVVVGDILIIRPGNRVAVDCVIISGESDIDTSAMTGESAPRFLSVGDNLDSGVVVLNGVLTCSAVRPAQSSAAARVLALVEEANERKSREETFITKFSRIYTPAVVSLAILMTVVPSAFGWLRFTDALYRALIFLVISCPCALVISVPMAFFGGIGAAASRGILFKGGNVFSAVASAECVAFDKTGTLTEGKLTVGAVRTFGCSKEEVLSLAASAEYGSNHPIAVAIKKNAVFEAPISVKEVAGKGVIARTSRGTVAVGNIALMTALEITVRDTASGVYVARDGVHIGTVILSDSVKSEASAAVNELCELGIRSNIILSGDRAENVKRVAEEIGISDYHAELSPEQKYTELEKIISTSKSTLYVGDGINDAPSLARADVGVAMGALGSDSAIEAADVVITSDELTRLPEAIRIARKTLRIAKQNIAFAIGVKLAVMLLGAFNLANMWLAVFADVGVSVIAILNSMRALAYKGKRK